ncbi:hypothetical protein Tco_0322114 [Tanacetum coccineum]
MTAILVPTTAIAVMYNSLTKEEQQIVSASRDLCLVNCTIAYKYNFQMPPHYTLLLRSLASFEGSEAEQFGNSFRTAQNFERPFKLNPKLDDEQQTETTPKMVKQLYGQKVKVNKIPMRVAAIQLLKKSKRCEISYIFLENAPNVIGNGQDWLFDVDSLSKSMNYVPVIAGNKTNGIAGKRDNIVADPKVSEEDAEEKPIEMDESGALDKDGEDDQATRSEFERLLQQEKQTVHPNSTNSIDTVSTPVSAAGPSFSNDDPSSPVNAAEASNAFEERLFEIFSSFKNAFTLLPISNVTPMDDTRIFGNAYDDEDVGAEADLNNLEATMNVSPIPTTRIDKDHPKD